MKHCTIGGSTASRTINCSSWIEKSKGMPRGKSSVYADVGNLLHDCMENYYQRDMSFEDQLAMPLTYADQTLTQDHIDTLVMPMFTATEAILDELDIDQIICEPFVLIEDDVGGSIDMLGLSSDGETVLVLDYKTGQKKVRAEENVQLLFYTLAAKADAKTSKLFAKAKRIVSAIVQPKVYGEKADTWSFDIPALYEFEDKLGEVLDNIDNGTTTTKSGPWCDYCPAASICGEKRQQAQSAQLMPLKTSEQVSAAIKEADALEHWIKDVRSQALHLAEEGVKIPDHKLVHGRSLRKWKSEAAAEQYLTSSLGDGAYTKKLLSPAQAEKALKDDKGLAAHIEKPAGKLTLVPVDDKRAAVQPKQIPDNLNKFLDKK